MSEQTKIDDGGPAYPVAENHKVADDLPWTCGLSIRDWFAGHVTNDEADGLIGPTVADAAKFLGIRSEEYQYERHYPQAIAKAKYTFADAMLAARKAAP